MIPESPGGCDGEATRQRSKFYIGKHCRMDDEDCLDTSLSMELLYVVVNKYLERVDTISSKSKNHERAVSS